MNIQPFAVEEWMNAYETGAKYNIAETCVYSLSIDQLLALSGRDRGEFLNSLCARPLTYGDIAGSPRLLEGVCRLYETMEPEHIVLTHGAAGANHHVFCSLISPGDHVVSIMPTYQQLYSIPQSIGARVDILELRREDGFLPDLRCLEELVTRDTRMICINDPNNPTGALMPRELKEAIVEIARRAGAYLLCDEVYRHLGQEDSYCPSAADMYEKGTSVSSMSKVFSLAGIRMGWIACRDPQALAAFRSHRDYDLISCSILDDAVAALALDNSGKILERNRSILRENLAALDAWVEATPCFSYVRPQAGTTALVYYDLGIPSYEFCTRLYEQTGAFVTPGDCFGQPKSMRIGYGCAGEVLKKGLEAISGFVRGL